MGDRSFVNAPSLGGFYVYCDIVKELLTYHNTIKNSYYDTENSGGTPLSNINNIINTLSNFVSSETSIPYGYGYIFYNWDVYGETQSLLMPYFTSLKTVTVNESHALNMAKNAVITQVRWLQKHLVDLITDSTSYTNINDYYATNQLYNNSSTNVLDGGYHFTSDWNRLSTSVGVPYNSTCDID